MDSGFHCLVLQIIDIKNTQALLPCAISYILFVNEVVLCAISYILTVYDIITCTLSYILIIVM